MKMSVSRRGYRPAGRREAFSVAHYNKFYLCHGIADLHHYNDDGTWIPQGEEGLPMQCFDFTAGTWKGIKPTTQEPGETRLWHSLSALYAGVCSVVVNDSLYSFGGRRGERERGSADVHELNLNTMVWRKVVPANPEEGPVEKEKGGMVDYKGELLCVFGGYGMGTSRRQTGATYHWDSAFDCFWNNELHLFDLQKSKLPAAMCLERRLKTYILEMDAFIASTYVYITLFGNVSTCTYNSKVFLPHKVITFSLLSPTFHREVLFHPLCQSLHSIHKSAFA